MLGGRPEKNIDWDEVNRLLECGSEGPEVASSIGVHTHTLYNQVKKKYKMSFSDYSMQKYSTGIGKIRRAQYEKAIGVTKKGDTQLLHFLGRVRLKQIEAQPEKETIKPPNDEILQLQDENIKLKYELSQFKNEIQPQAGTELPRSDSTI